MAAHRSKPLPPRVGGRRSWFGRVLAMAATSLLLSATTPAGHAQEAADLSIVLEPHGRIVVDAGEVVDLSITVANAGPGEAVGAALFIETGSEIVSLPPSCEPVPTTTHTCPLDTLAAGEERTVGLSVRAGSQVRVWVLLADDPYTPDNFDTLVIDTPTTSDMSVAVEPVEATVRVGESLDLVVTFGNAGPLVARGHGFEMFFNRNLPINPLPFPRCDRAPGEAMLSCIIEQIEVGAAVTGTMTLDFTDFDLSAGSTVTWSAQIFHRVPYSELPEDRHDNQSDGSITVLPALTDEPTPTPQPTPTPTPGGLDRDHGQDRDASTAPTPDPSAVPTPAAALPVESPTPAEAATSAEILPETGSRPVLLLTCATLVIGLGIAVVRATSRPRRSR